jgi:para-nitrobenzyl esterase
MKAIVASLFVGFVVLAPALAAPASGAQATEKAATRQKAETGQKTAAKGSASLTPTAEMKIDSGALRGLVVGEKQDIDVYKGIPFAAPPVGERRWQAPQPAAAWQGVRDCFEFGAACPQKVPARYGSIPELDLNVPTSEDCLFLNVWTPAQRGAKNLPVLYWIHGGGFTMGAASQPLYDGEGLARLGCVVVSINYRLGALGFLAHPALSRENKDNVSGNYGLLDQIEGLRWVHRNIAAFGGDPQRVTIFGESAGGGSVLCLMVSPLAKGLFHGAIAQSAAGAELTRLRETQGGRGSAEEAGKRFVAKCGLPETADAAQMRHLDPEALLKAASSNEPRPGGDPKLGRLSLVLGPILDGQTIPDEPDAIFAAGREEAVPLIIGNTKDEMSMFLTLSKMPVDEPAYLKLLKTSFDGLADVIAQAYPAKDPKQIRPTVIQLASDLAFILEARSMARKHAAAGQKTFRYEFARGTKRGFLQFLGAHHGAELAYVFQHPIKADDAAEKRIMRTMGRYWVNFAATGDPNGAGVPSWPTYRAGADEMVQFGDDVKVLSGHRNSQLDAIEKYLRGSSSVTRQTEH